MVVAGYLGSLGRRGVMVLKLMCGILIVVAAYFSWEAFANDHLVWLTVPAVLLAVAVGLASARKWGVALWYLFALATSCWWLGTMVNMALSGWPSDSLADTIISLVPGISLLMFCGLGSVEVHRTLVRRATAAP